MLAYYTSEHATMRFYLQQVRKGTRFLTRLNVSPPTVRVLSEPTAISPSTCSEACATTRLSAAASPRTSCARLGTARVCQRSTAKRMTTITSRAWLAPLMPYAVCQTGRTLNSVVRADADVEGVPVVAAVNQNQNQNLNQNQDHNNFILSSYDIGPTVTIVMYTKLDMPTCRPLLRQFMVAIIEPPEEVVATIDDSPRALNQRLYLRSQREHYHEYLHLNVFDVTFSIDVAYETG